MVAHLIIYFIYFNVIDYLCIITEIALCGTEAVTIMRNIAEIYPGDLGTHSDSLFLDRINSTLFLGEVLTNMSNFIVGAGQQFTKVVRYMSSDK